MPCGPRQSRSCWPGTPTWPFLQEVGPGALEALKEAGGNVAVSPQDPWEPWPREHYDRWPMVVKLSDRVKVEWFRQVLPTTPEEGDDEIAVSNVGIIAAVRVIPLVSGKPFIAVSMYARWFRPHPLTGKTNNIHSDRSAHLIMSDLAAFIWDTVAPPEATSAITGSWRPATSTTSTGPPKTTDWFGTNEIGACSTAWRRWAWNSWDRSIPPAD